MGWYYQGMTVFSHLAVPIAARLGAGKLSVPNPLLITGMILSVLPDADVVSFRLGIPYAAGLGHRGFSHSLLFAAVAALGGALLMRAFKIPMRNSLWYLSLSAVSHGLLDALTTGGYGIAFFWPLSDQRFLAPVRMIDAWPLRASRFFSSGGMEVLKSELAWVCMPLVGVGLIAFALRNSLRKNTGSSYEKPVGHQG